VHRAVRARTGRAPEPLSALAADALVATVVGGSVVNGARVDEAGVDGAGLDGAGGATPAAARHVSSGARTKTTVHVVVDHATLIRGRAEPGERCEIPGVGPVSVGWVHSLLGEAFLTLVVRKGRDITTVAHLGRKYPAELLTAMIVAGRECAVAGCGNRGYLELDHSEIDVAFGGPTAWWNLTWLCSVDHRRKTAGWRLGPRDPQSGKRPLSPPSRGP
jgi:hypothetical protein